MSRKIYIGCDHGGYEMKKALVDIIVQEGWEIVDVGCDTTDIVRYPYYAAKVAKAVASEQADRGLLICSTGIGMSVIANKYRGVRAALCTSEYMGRMTREHNDSNILCIGGKITEEAEAIRILRVWLNTNFVGERHSISLGLIAEAERQMINNMYWSSDAEV